MLKQTLIILFLISFLNANKKPNILYINADDWGVMDVQFNSKDFKTPNIDKLKQQGLSFQNAYAPAANCAPSRACVLSGQWSDRHGVYTVGSSERGNANDRKLIPIKNTEHLKPSMFVMSKALQEAGYKTIHLGKFHVGFDPLKYGFDVNIGGNDSGSVGKGDYFSPWKARSMQPFNKQYPKKTHRIDVFAKETIKFINDNKENSMFIHFSPYSVHTALDIVQPYFQQAKKTTKDKKKAMYMSMVSKFDEAIGKVITCLQENNLLENTLIVISSDNGGIRAISSQKPYRAGKGSYYEGGIKVPLVITWKGVIKQSTTKTPVSTLDLYPTFLEVAKAKKKENHQLDGTSIVPLFNNKELKKRALYWHFPVYLQKYSENDQSADKKFRTRPGAAIRYENYKLIHYYEDNNYEFYNLETDIGEKNNLIKQDTEQAKKMIQMLDKWRKKINAKIPTELNKKYKHYKK